MKKTISVIAAVITAAAALLSAAAVVYYFIKGKQVCSFSTDDGEFFDC